MKKCVTSFLRKISNVLRRSWARDSDNVRAVFSRRRSCAACFSISRRPRSLIGPFDPLVLRDRHFRWCRSAADFSAQRRVVSMHRPRLAVVAKCCCAAVLLVVPVVSEAERKIVRRENPSQRTTTGRWSLNIFKAFCVSKFVRIKHSI